jgi:ribose/xylose/arabinose/galactoside ABC-type transport system permease subunit
MENRLLWVSMLFALTIYVANWFVLHPMRLFREFLRHPEKFLGSAREVCRLAGVFLYFISVCVYVCSILCMAIVEPYLVLTLLLFSVLSGLMAPIAMVLSNNLRV